MTTALTVELLAVLGTHLGDFELPGVASVHITIGTAGPEVCVQLACHHQPPAVAAGLLAWADTLTETSAQAWRVPRGDTVHLSITGRLPGGTEVLVYGGVPVTDLRLCADLAPGAKQTLTLAALRCLAIPGLVTEEVIPR